MKLAFLCVLLIAQGCRGPKSAVDVDRGSQELYRTYLSKIDTGSRGRAHEFDLVGFCTYCGKDQAFAASCEACPVASDGWRGKARR